MFALPWPGASLLIYPKKKNVEFGVLSLKTENIYWTKCREFLQNNFYYSSRDREGFLMFVPNTKPKRAFAQVRRRLVQLQDKMGLKPHQRATVVDTERDDMVYIRLSVFWRVKHRFSFLTAFVRNAKNLSHTSLKAVLTLGRYFTETQPAVKRLVSGHFTLKTMQTKAFRGWSNVFKNKPAKAVAAMLV